MELWAEHPMSSLSQRGHDMTLRNAAFKNNSNLDEDGIDHNAVVQRMQVSTWFRNTIEWEQSFMGSDSEKVPNCA